MSGRRDSGDSGGMQAEAPPTLTFAASLYLPHGGQGVGQQVGQAAVQVNGGQAALEALAGVDQLGQVAVHLLGDATDVQVAWRGGATEMGNKVTGQDWYSSVF